MSLSGKLTVVAAVVVVSLYCLPTQTLATLCNDNTNYYNCPPVGSPEATTCCPYSGPTLSGPYCCSSTNYYDYPSISYSGVSLAGWQIGLIVVGNMIWILGLSCACYYRRRRILGQRRVTNVQTVTLRQGGATRAGAVPGGVVPTAVVARPYPGSVPPPYPGPTPAAVCATVVSAPQYTGPQAKTMPATLDEAPPYSEVAQQYPTAPQDEGTDREHLVAL